MQIYSRLLSKGKVRFRLTMNIFDENKNCLNCKYFCAQNSQRYSYNVILRGQCCHGGISRKTKESRNENCSLWEDATDYKNHPFIVVLAQINEKLKSIEEKIV